MTSSVDNYYSVVQFLHKPHPNIDGLVIVPDSWIEPRGDRILVLYPASVHQRDIKYFYNMKPNETPSNVEWNKYLSEFIYTANSYKDAQNHINKVSNEKRKKKPKLSQEKKKDAFKEESQIPGVSKKIGVTDNKCQSKKIKNIQNKPDRRSGLNEKLDVNNFAAHVETFGNICLNYSKQIKTYFDKKSEKNKEDAMKIPTKDKKKGITEDQTLDPMEELMEDSREDSTMEIEDPTAAPMEDLIVDPTEDIARPTENGISIEVTTKHDNKHSRSTLKHPTIKSGIDRLVAGSEVYLESEKVLDILDLSDDTVTFARLLLTEIFSEMALATCTLEWKFSATNIVIHTDLNKDGLNVLLTTVRYIEEKKNWTPVSDENLLVALNDKLLTVQRKRKAIESSLGK